MKFELRSAKTGNIMGSADYEIPPIAGDVIWFEAGKYRVEEREIPEEPQNLAQLPMPITLLVSRYDEQKPMESTPQQHYKTDRGFLVTGFRSWELLNPDEQADIRNRFYSSVMNCLVWRYDPVNDVWIHE